MVPSLLFALVNKADTMQFMYFSCNVGFSSLPGKHLDLVSSSLKTVDLLSFLANDSERYGIQ